MKKNFEIKTKLSNPERIKSLLRIFCKGKKVIRQKQTQEDIYYKVSRGRLKLRVIDGRTGNLIHYFRNNETGKRVSKYTISETNTPKELNSILSSLYGVMVIVKKSREIIILNNVRIHIDNVIGLGNYLEIEIIFKSIKEAEKQMSGLIENLKLDDKKFIKVSYSDLLLKKRRKNAS